MNTPDTEWSRQAFRIIMGEYGSDTFNEMDNLINSIISSHTTYWKERVRKEVEGIRKPETTFLKEGDETWDYSHIIAHNLALDTLLDNLK